MAFFPKILFIKNGDNPTPGLFVVKFFKVNFSPLKINFLLTIDFFHLFSAKFIKLKNYSIVTILYSQSPFFLNVALTQFKVFSSYQTSVFNFLSFFNFLSVEEKLKCKAL